MKEMNLLFKMTREEWRDHHRELKIRIMSQDLTTGKVHHQEGNKEMTFNKQMTKEDQETQMKTTKDTGLRQEDQVMNKVDLTTEDNRRHQ